MSGASLSSRAVIRLVAAREVRERLRAKSFWIFTGLLVVVVIATGFIGRLAEEDGPGPIDVAVTESAPEGLAPAIEQTAEQVDRTATVDPYADADEARAAVEDGDDDVAVLVSDTGEPEIVFHEEEDQEVVAVLQQAIATVSVQQGLEAEGLDQAQIDAALATPPVDVTVLDDSGEDDGLAILTGTVTAVLLFLVLQTFGTYVLMGVVEEKSTAVVEVLLARARPDQLLAGKIIGIGIAALVQLTATLAAGAGSLVISGVEVPGDVWATLPMVLVWFLGGYALYSTLFALAGSLVSRQEEAQGAAAPIFTALIGAYLLVFIFGYVPDSTVSAVLSVIPPITPLLMPMRMAAGAATPFEIGLAVVLMVLTTWGAWKLSGRIYEQVLLQRGSRISWRKVWELLRGSGRTA